METGNIKSVVFLLAFISTTAYLRAQQTTDISATQEDTFRDIRAILLAKEIVEEVIIDSDHVKDFKITKRFSVFTFDFNSLALHIDQAIGVDESDPNKKPYDNEQPIRIGQKHFLVRFEYEERPMYFDYEGFVYTKGKGKKGRWVKTPLTTLYKFMSVPFAFPDIFPELKIPETNYSYYGIDVSPGRYPILEWAFRYKMQYFEASENFKHEFVEYGSEGGNSKYILQAGKDRGSFVIFDGLGRLREINSIHSGMIQYTYGNYTVKLPDSNKTDYFSDELNMMNMFKKQ